MKKFPAARGAFLALLAALLFGASTPLVQRKRSTRTHTQGLATNPAGKKLLLRQEGLVSSIAAINHSRLVDL
jgi:hypothetical protein